MERYEQCDETKEAQVRNLFHFGAYDCSNVRM